MKHLLWVIPLVLGLAAMYRPGLLSVALGAMLVCGVVWIASLVLGSRGPSADTRGEGTARAERDRDPYDVQRNIPPNT